MADKLEAQSVVRLKSEIDGTRLHEQFYTSGLDTYTEIHRGTATLAAGNNVVTVWEQTASETPQFIFLSYTDSDAHVYFGTDVNGVRAPFMLLSDTEVTKIAFGLPLAGTLAEDISIDYLVVI
jgi:hypothetical protein